MLIAFSKEAWEEYQYFVENEYPLSLKITALIKEIMRHPFKGMGKPEPLKRDLQGYWSRRINGEHRLIYKVTEELIIIKQCRYHYQK